LKAAKIQETWLWKNSVARNIRKGSLWKIRYWICSWYRASKASGTAGSL